MVHRKSKTMRGLFAAASLTTVLAMPAAAGAAEPSWGLKDAYDTVYERVDRAGGEPGRHIVEDGVRKSGDARGATRAEVKESLATLRSMTGTPATGASSSGSSEAAPSTGGTAPAAPSGGSAGSGLESVAACESGGDPSAVSSDGQYRGKYQFDQQTWESVGGSGDPASAPEGEQDQRAAALQSQRGSNPWPVCGG